jgi:dolichyl-diphosphooligosaccharide--protein glycosyltransferase
VTNHWLRAGLAAVAVAVVAPLVPPRWAAFDRIGMDRAWDSTRPGDIGWRMVRGKRVVVDENREAYEWLHHKTPTNARIVSWWDYGYQMAGISHRTTLADGNTWNHEHIGAIGYMLASSMKNSHSVMRHVADYLLVFRNDIMISPHFANIGKSVFPFLCDKGACDSFNFRDNDHNKPNAMMRDSVVYNAVYHNTKQGVRMDPALFKEVFSTTTQKIRIYQLLNVSEKSRAWIEDNRVCDAPGSWYCPGQYPPAWKKFLAKRRSFKQLEDFNRK